MPRIIAPTVTARYVVQGFIEEKLGASEHPGVRRVQLLIPPGQPVGFAIDHPDPVSAGPGRVFMLPPAPAGQLISFHLLPQQRLYASTGDGGGLAVIGCIIEYLEG